MEKAKKLVRGIRNNNPGNIRDSIHYQWLGQTARDADRYCIFSDPVYGYRALAILWLHYGDWHHCKTLADYIKRWAPPGGNPTASYISYVSDRCGLPKHEIIQVRHDLPCIAKAITWFENGSCPYSDALIQRGINMSLEH